MYYSIHDSDHTTVADNLTKAEMVAKLRDFSDEMIHRHGVAEWENSGFGDVLLGTTSAEEALHRADQGRDPVPA